MRKFDESRNPDPRGTMNFGYSDWMDSPVINHYERMTEEVLTLAMNPSRGDQGRVSMIEKSMDEICRCFTPDSIEEIRERLRAENSAFGRDCLEKMDKNSPTAQALTLSLLRRAERQSYGHTLRDEMKVFLNRMRDEEFQDTGLNRLYHQNRPDKFKSFNPGDLDKYYEDPEGWEEIRIKTEPGSAMPIKDYNKVYKPPMVMYLNQTNTSQKVVRDSYKQDLKNCMIDHGIDFRDGSSNYSTINAALDAQQNFYRDQEYIRKQVHKFAADRQMVHNYYTKIEGEINKLNNPSVFHKFMNEAIDRHFEN